MPTTHMFVEITVKNIKIICSTEKEKKMIMWLRILLLRLSIFLIVKLLALSEYCITCEHGMLLVADDVFSGFYYCL